MKLNITKKNISKALYGAGTVAAASLLVAGATAQTNNTTQNTQDSENNTTTSLGEFPEPYVTDNEVNSIVVFGESASETDVNSARNLAETLYSQTDQTPETENDNTTEETSQTSIEVPLTTENERLYLGSTIDSSRNILTEEDLDSLSTTTFDAGEEDTEIEQFLRVGNQNVTFGRPNDDAEPFLYIENPVPSQDEHLYELEANMDSPADLTSDDAAGQELSLFGRTFTVSEETTQDELVLLTGQRDLELRTNQSRTVTIDGSDHTVSVVSVNDGQVAARINGELRQFEEGESFSLNDASMRVQELIDLEGSNGIVRFSAGSTELTLSGGSISSGDEEISGIGYEAAGNFSSLQSLSFFIGANDEDRTYVREGSSYSSNLFSPSFSFEGFSSEEGSSVEINPGETAEVSFTTSEGEANVGFSTLANNSTVFGNDDGDTFGTYQNQSLTEDDYLPTDAAGFSRLWRIESVDADSDLSEGEATLQLEDELSESSASVELQPSDGIYKAEKVIDGRSFTFYVTPEEEVSAVWDPDSTPLFPALETGDGSAVSIIDDAMLDFEGERTFRLPASSGEPTVTISSSNGTVEAVSSSSGVETRTENGTVIATVEGGQEYGFRTQNGEVMAGAYTDNIIDDPSILIIEPSNGDDQQEAYVARTEVDDEDVIVDQPNYTGFRRTAETEEDVTVGYDRFGAYSTHDPDDGGFTLSIPESQSYALIGFSNSMNQTSTEQTDMEQTGQEMPNIVYNASNPEVSELRQDQNVILVGGPAVNSLTQELASQGVTPTADQYEEGSWLLQSTEAFNGDTLIVAGTTADETEAAADYLSNYQENSERLENRSILISTEVETQ